MDALFLEIRRRDIAAICVAMLAIFFGWSPSLMQRSGDVAAAADRLLVARGDTYSEQNSGSPDIAPAELPPLPPFGAIRKVVRFAFAERAPVIVGTGGREPIQLGEHVPYQQGADTLHVWNWDESNVSRVYEDVRLSESQRFAVSADGRQLVWAHGDILNLETGQRSEIDLGGSHFDSPGDEQRRIQDLRFSPDGTKLAILVSNFDAQRGPAKIPVQVIQLLEFPSGTPICEIPSGLWTSLRIGFSPDGQRMFSNGLHVKERSMTTGETIREYEPQLQDYAYAFEVWDDGQLLAVADGERKILIWDTSTGVLRQRIDRPGQPFEMCVRFSPDGCYLAISQILDVPIIEVATGRVVATLPQEIAEDFRWSADGETLTTITSEGFGAGTKGSPPPNIFPAVHEWRWRTGAEVRRSDVTN